MESLHPTVGLSCIRPTNFVDTASTRLQNTTTQLGVVRLYPVGGRHNEKIFQCEWQSNRTLHTQALILLVAS
jgi:hypothetical protein